MDTKPAGKMKLFNRIENLKTVDECISFCKEISFDYSTHSLNQEEWIILMDATHTKGKILLVDETLNKIRTSGETGK